MRCPRCRACVERIYDAPAVKVNHTNRKDKTETSHYDHALGAVVTSATQRREIMKRKGLQEADYGSEQHMKEKFDNLRHKRWKRKKTGKPAGNPGRTFRMDPNEKTDTKSILKKHFSGKKLDILKKKR